MSPASPTTSTGASSTCPNCGAPLRFGGAASVAAVCEYCRSAVARAGADLELLGKVPDLVATDTRLGLGVAGRIDGLDFTVIGHLQLARLDDDDHRSAPWSEWYCAFADGAWGWIAEAQGRLLFTTPRESDSPPPRLDPSAAGTTVALPGGRYYVDEVGRATFVAAAGELPFRPALGVVYHYADCSDAAGGFVTLDYGEEGSAADEAVLYVGRELEYADAGLADLPPAPPYAGSPREKARALACPSCGGSLSLKRPDTESLTCPSCGSLLDVASGSAKLLAALAARSKPTIPLGTRSVEGDALEVLGWIRRRVRVEGEDYFWDEYLLHGDRGYRWLVESNGDWTLVTPIAGGRVLGGAVGAPEVNVGGTTFRAYQSGTAWYAEIQGEFYWRIDAAAPVFTADWIAPPRLCSMETDGREINWSTGAWLDGKEVWRRFGLGGDPPPVTGVGATRENPYAGSDKAVGAMVVALVTLAAAAVVLALATPRSELISVEVPLAADQPVTLSEPFTIPAGPRAVEIEAFASVYQTWVGLDVALINDDTGDSDVVGFELSRYAGVDDGESWSEGSREGSAIIGSVPGGRYLLRVEPQAEKSGGAALPATATVKVGRGRFLWPPFLLAIVLIAIWPLFRVFRDKRFERRRWEDSNFADHEAPSAHGDDHAAALAAADAGAEP